MKTALGFRTHSGWAAVVAIELSPEPVVCDRRTVVLADPAIRGSKQPFHAAEPMPLPMARVFLRRCEDRTCALAVAAIRDIARALDHRGREVAACALIAGSGRVPDSIDAILASHAAIHTAEGELYRDAIAHACEHCKLPLLRIREKEAMAAAESALGITSAQIQSHLVSMGRAVGAPWTQDQKLAALAAWVALANFTPAVKRKVVGARA